MGYERLAGAYLGLALLAATPAHAASSAAFTGCDSLEKPGSNATGLARAAGGP